MSRKLLAGTLAAAAGGVALVVGLNEPPVVYARSVSELLAHPVRDTQVRVQGKLVDGSLCRVLDPCEYRFRLTDHAWQLHQPDRDAGDAASTAAAPELPVRYRSCVIPDTFGTTPGLDVEAAVEGELCSTCHVFEASSIMAKCSGKYEIGAHRARDPVPLCRQ